MTPLQTAILAAVEETGSAGVHEMHLLRCKAHVDWVTLCDALDALKTQKLLTEHHTPVPKPHGGGYMALSWQLTQAGKAALAAARPGTTHDDTTRGDTSAGQSI